MHVGPNSVDPVKRKVISELFFAPSVVLPIVGGLSAGLLSWASGGSAYLTGGAMMGLLGGVGWMLTRMIFKVEDITEKAMQAELQKRVDEEARELDDLALQLRTDRDHRTQDYLTLLRSLRDQFEESANESGALMRSARIREQVGQIFEAAVEQLRHSYRLWELSENLVGTARETVLTNREHALAEIEVTIERLRGTVDQFRGILKKQAGADLASMREELEATIRIAKRTEERMRQIENASEAHERYILEKE